MNVGEHDARKLSSSNLYSGIRGVFSKSLFSPTSLYETVFKYHITADMFNLTQFSEDLAKLNTIIKLGQNKKMGELKLIKQKEEAKRIQEEQRLREEKKQQETKDRQDSLNKQLHYAFDEIIPNVRKIRSLINKGADVNFQNHEDGYTPLMIAVAHQNDQIAEYLLNQGASPLLRNKYGEIASNLASRGPSTCQILKGYELIHAAKNYNLPAVKKLLKDGADINFKGMKGYTPLLTAVELEAVELVEYLLLQGADPTITSDDDIGPFDLTTNSKIHKLLSQEYSNSEPVEADEPFQFDRANLAFDRWFL